MIERGPQIATLVVTLVLSWVVLFSESIRAEPESESAKEQRKRSLDEMQSRARSTKISTRSDTKKQTVAPILPQPIFRYSDQARFIEDATVWAWGEKGRPLALCKIERYDRGPNNRDPRPWLINLVSLSTELIEAEWSFGKQWVAQKPGLKLQTLTSGPTPSDSPLVRIRQMKEISRRFASTMIIPITDQRQEMRLLSRPLFRYSDIESGLRDGAIFGLTNYGTNPDALLIIELHQPENSEPTWSFGCAGMTQGALSVRLDGKEVWTKGWTDGPGAHENWIYFFESPVAE